MMIIYHYHRNTGEYLRESTARVSPLDQQNHLIPACATEFPPPVAGEHEVAVFADGSWSIQPDYRGTWFSGRDRVEVGDIGPLPAGYTAEPEPYSKTEILEQLLAEIDADTAIAQQQPFEYAGNRYVPDTEFIQGMYSAVTGGLLPSDHVEEWKTADKARDGVNNVYTLLDVAGIVGLAGAFLMHKKTVWAAGEERKKRLKAIFLDNTKSIDDMRARI